MAILLIKVDIFYIWCNIFDVTFHKAKHKSKIIPPDEQETFTHPASTFPSLRRPSPGIFPHLRAARVQISTAGAARSASPPRICCPRFWPSGTASTRNRASGRTPWDPVRVRCSTRRWRNSCAASAFWEAGRKSDDQTQILVFV